MKTFVLLWAILFAFIGVKAQFTVTQMSNPDTKNHDLYCSFSLNKDYGFAAGNRILLKRVNDQWSSISLGSAFPTFVSVWASDPNNIKLIAKDGVIFHSDGQLVSHDTDLVDNLYCAKFFSANDYFVGGQGYLFHYKDGTWSSFALPGSTYEIVGIEGNDPSDLLLFINVNSSESEVAAFKNGIISELFYIQNTLYKSQQFGDKYYFCGSNEIYVYDKQTNNVVGLLNTGAIGIYVLGVDSFLLGDASNFISYFDNKVNSHLCAAQLIYSFSSSTDDPNHIYAVGAGGQIFKITNTSIGINEAPEITPEINVYPNPAKDFVNIDLSNQNDKTLISIFDYSGKIVLRTEIDQVLTKLNISSLDSGLYFIRGESAKSSFTKKLVIAR